MEVSVTPPTAVFRCFVQVSASVAEGEEMPQKAAFSLELLQIAVQYQIEFAIRCLSHLATAPSKPVT
jgi:hypothetical protein